MSLAVSGNLMHDCSSRVSSLSSAPVYIRIFAQKKSSRSIRVSMPSINFQPSRRGLCAPVNACTMHDQPASQPGQFLALGPVTLTPLALPHTLSLTLCGIFLPLSR
jgi:hypothetical protein